MFEWLYKRCKQLYVHTTITELDTGFVVFLENDTIRHVLLTKKGKTTALFTLTCLIFASFCPHSPSRYAHMLTPYMNSVPAVIAKASAIYNPIIYAITHPKYR